MNSLDKKCFPMKAKQHDIYEEEIFQSVLNNTLLIAMPQIILLWQQFSYATEPLSIIRAYLVPKRESSYVTWKNDRAFEKIKIDCFFPQR